MGRSENTSIGREARTITEACPRPQADSAGANVAVFAEGQVAAWQPISWALMVPVVVAPQIIWPSYDAAQLSNITCAHVCINQSSQCFNEQPCSRTGDHSMAAPQMISSNDEAQLSNPTCAHVLINHGSQCFNEQPCSCTEKHSMAVDQVSSRPPEVCSYSRSDHAASVHENRSRKKRNSHGGQHKMHRVKQAGQRMDCEKLQAQLAGDSSEQAAALAAIQDEVVHRVKQTGQRMDCQKLQAQLAGDSSEQAAALSAIQDEVVQMAFDSQGCRVVQLALAVALGGSRLKLADAFKTRVREASVHHSANFVIQEMITVLPVAFTSFVPQELKGAATEVARNKHGCRIFCRLLEHPGSAETIEVVEEALQDVPILVRNAYGRYVIQAILEYGSAAHRKHIVDALFGNLVLYAQCRIASTVVEKALDYASTAETLLMAEELLAEEKQVLSLAASRYGRFVVKAIFQLPGWPSMRVSEILRAGEDLLSKSKFGISCLECLAEAQAAK